MTYKIGEMFWFEEIVDNGIKVFKIKDEDCKFLGWRREDFVKYLERW